MSTIDSLGELWHSREKEREERKERERVNEWMNDWVPELSLYALYFYFYITTTKMKEFIS
jgi:hypothetical protein